MKKLLLIIISICLLGQAKAQLISQEVLDACPEMQIGKAYSTEGLAAAKKNFPQSVRLGSGNRAKQYPFAKITTKDNVTIFSYTQLFAQSPVSVHCYMYSKKNAFLDGRSYLFQEGEVESIGTYKGFVKRISENEFSVEEKVNDEVKKAKTYLIRERSFQNK